MAKQEAEADALRELLEQGARDERRLLKRERRAERRLTDALAEVERQHKRLARQQAKVSLLEAEVAAASATLRREQAARALGPHPASPAVGTSADALRPVEDGGSDDAGTGAPAEAAEGRSKSGRRGVGRG